jgi:hypothetical protein
MGKMKLPAESACFAMSALDLDIDGETDIIQNHYSYHPETATCQLALGFGAGALRLECMEDGIEILVFDAAGDSPR